uniref:Uncharacterized protein n=1 Tax=Ochrobactrum phage ORM_20 TaxID=2985243 RepID=A0A9N6WZZ0_9VIRU|nr:hypothetical protein ORM20_00162 [Ochrobactrum phage ORM_20]
MIPQLFEQEKNLISSNINSVERILDQFKMVFKADNYDKDDLKYFGEKLRVATDMLVNKL